jgi:hypothetical protein
MKARAAAVAIATAAFLLAGCVWLVEPAGEVAPLSKDLRWEGAWISDELIVLLFVDDADKGTLQYCGLMRAKKKDEPPARLQCYAAQLRKTGDDYVLNVALDELYKDGKTAAREPAARRWHFVLLRRDKDRVFVWMVDHKEARRLVEAGELEGRATARSGLRDEVEIDRLDPGLLRRWASGEVAGFLWRSPAVFDYHSPFEKKFKIEFQYQNPLLAKK